MEQVIIPHTQQIMETGQTIASCETHGGRVDFPFVVIVVIFIYCRQRDEEIQAPLSV